MDSQYAFAQPTGIQNRYFFGDVLTWRCPNRTCDQNRFQWLWFHRQIPTDGARGQPPVTIFNNRKPLNLDLNALSSASALSTFALGKTASGSVLANRPILTHTSPFARP